MAPIPSGTAPSRSASEAESWVEVGSRPSSSSLSSVANDIITTGLTVQHDSNMHRRRRRSRPTGSFQIGTGYRVTNKGGSSSQEEYDESESESDRVMTSSTEAMGPALVRQVMGVPYSVASSEAASEREDDDDENATAVNYPRSSPKQFEPRPDAFSHPLTQPTLRAQAGTPNFGRRPPARQSPQRHSFPQHRLPQTDHDEALRASLSTLLSAAAAVRGRSKPGQPRLVSANSARIDPTTLRLVPESVALGGIAEESASSRTASISSPRTASSSPSDKSKRKALPNMPTSARSASQDRRAVKKVHRSASPNIDEISPTLLTWVVSAGVVVLVSALSFSAGYVVGKEAGHADAVGQLGAAVAEAGRCGEEAASSLRGADLGLKRLRWSGASMVRV